MGLLANEDWRKDGCQWGERKQKGGRKEEDGTLAPMTPTEIKKGGTEQPNQLFHPCPVCTVCTVEETACRHGEGFQW